MKLNNIGKVLFVDDDYETIADATTAFLDQGIPVQYWKGTGNLPRSIFNVRIVIIDLDLEGLNMRVPGDQFYFPAIEALRKIPGPFIVIIVAREFDPIDPIKLKEVYNHKVGLPLCGYIASEGLTKDKLENPTYLEDLIVSLLEKNEILHLILSWEGIFDKAKDAAISDIMLYDVDAPIRALVKLLCDNSGEGKATARELIDVMIRLVSRRTSETEEVDNLVKLISGINKGQIENDYPSFEDLRLYSKLMFYLPSAEEEIMTGDIFETSERFKYGLILTPKCDIIQGHTEKVLVCYGFPLRRENFWDPDFPPYKIDPKIVELCRKKKEKNIEEKIVGVAENRYFRESLPAGLPIMWNFCPEDGTFGICLDFNNVQSIEISEINEKWKVKKTWKRLSRIDTPYIEEILQKYGSLVSRVGTLQINRSPSKLEEEMKELKGQSGKTKKPKNQTTA